MSIKSKLILIVTATIFIIGMTAGILVTWQIKEILTNQIQKNIEDKINYSQELVNFYFGRVKDNTNNLAKDPLLAEALIAKDPQKIQQISDKMTTIVDTISVMETMALMEVKGSTCVNVTASKASLSIVGKDFSDRDYCKGIVKTKAPYLSSVYIGAVTKHPNLAMVIPVNNSKGEMIGFVSGVINVDELRGYLWDLQKNGSYTVLLDRYNKPFVDTRVKIEKIPESSEEESLMQNKAEKAFLSQKDYFIGYDRFASFTILYAEPMEILQNDINKIISTVILITVLAVILPIGFLFFIISRIVSRLNAVTETAKKISGGNMETRIDEKYAKTKDEIGILATAFNQMLGKLHDLYSSLEKKVEERTRELEEKTKKLEASEGEIKKALESSERANKLMVGREIEMIKLKEKIKELEEAKITKEVK